MRVEFPGPVGRLIGELEEPAGTPRGVAVVCHPHPAHGGSARNAIVVRVARGLREVGLATLRFHFRGVEGSEGTHDGTQETEDAIAAAALLSARHLDLPLWMAGYSFGARIAAEVAGRDAGVERLILVAYPCTLYDPGGLAHLRQPRLVVQGEADPFGDGATLRRRLAVLPPDLELVEIPGADHFFRGRTPLVEAAVLRYARAELDGPTPER